MLLMLYLLNIVCCIAVRGTWTIVSGWEEHELLYRGEEHEVLYQILWELLQHLRGRFKWDYKNPSWSPAPLLGFELGTLELVPCMFLPWHTSRYTACALSIRYFNFNFEVMYIIDYYWVISIIVDCCGEVAPKIVASLHIYHQTNCRYRD
jgi:hypothetical protein